jgi:solute carrier family 35, member F5
MLITLSSDYIYVLSMLKTTPLVVTIGLSLTIPLAVVGDLIFNKPASGQVLIGATLVLISFIAVGVANSKAENEDSLDYEGVETQVQEESPREGSSGSLSEGA